MIPRLDRLILKDIIPPWLFGVGLFASLLMAATYLGRIAGFIVDGVPPLLVLELFCLLMMPLLTKTFTMSVLLATLLAFGRLSSDSEIVALRAAGASIYRIIVPVAAFSAVMAAATFVFNENFVPVAQTRYNYLTTAMIKSVKAKGKRPMAQSYVEKGKLVAAIIAEDVNPVNQTMQGVSIVSYRDSGERSYMMFADRLELKLDDGTNILDAGTALNNSLYHWRVRGNVRLVSPDFSVVTKIDNDVWPSQIPTIRQNFTQFTEPKDADFDRFTMSQLRDFILLHRRQGDITSENLNNFEYGYWGKVAIPLGAVMFGLLGAVLGIRSHRTSTASGYGIAIGLTFAFVLLGNIMNTFAQGGLIPPWSAAFTPLVIGSLASGVIMWRRNG